jgi:hypothetical protein
MHDLAEPRGGHEDESMEEVNKFAAQGYKVICYGYCEMKMA